MQSSGSFFKSHERVSKRILALQYRPHNFSDLVGQEVLVQVLKSSLDHNRFPSSIILSGMRGVGKTTTARIIARALNCRGLDGRNLLPTSLPCGQCSSCKSITEDRHLDVIEIDAASNTSVDNIRYLIETSSYMAMSSNYKVYIIDEVHMLTKQAFNAFLKTLEDPPSHVKFILATTEIDRVPDTIVSRCMRFDLQRIESKTMKRHLMKISKNECVDIESEALDLLALSASGSMREAIFLLEKAIIMSDGPIITTSLVRKILGLLDQSVLQDLYKSILHGEIVKTLVIFHDQYSKGIDPLDVLHNLLSYTHTLVLCKINLEPKLNGDNKYSPSNLELAHEVSVPLLINFWKNILTGIHEAQIAPLASQAVEMILVRLAIEMTSSV